MIVGKCPFDLARSRFTGLNSLSSSSCMANPVLVDVVSGEIKPVEWKQGTTDTLEMAPVKDSIMAITDESYFDWPVLPEAPSSLNVSLAGNAAKLTWQVH